jgi:hypothetical protein
MALDATGAVKVLQILYTRPYEYTERKQYALSKGARTHAYIHAPYRACRQQVSERILHTHAHLKNS